MLFFPLLFADLMFVFQLNSLQLLSERTEKGNQGVSCYLKMEQKEKVYENWSQSDLEKQQGKKAMCAV